MSVRHGTYAEEGFRLVRVSVQLAQKGGPVVPANYLATFGDMLC